MPKPDLGVKRKCVKCDAFFYDLKKAEFACPKCGEKYTAATYEQSKMKQLMKLAKKAAPKLDDGNLDEDALLQMTEDVPLTDEEIGNEELDIIEQDENTVHEHPLGEVGEFDPSENG